MQMNVFCHAGSLFDTTHLVWLRQAWSSVGRVLWRSVSFETADRHNRGSLLLAQQPYATMRWISSVKASSSTCIVPTAVHAVVDRYTRAEHSQSKQTIQQLLRELMLLRDAMSRSQGSNTAGGRSGTCGNNPPGIAVNGSSSSSRGGAGTDGGAGSPTASSLTSSKQMSKGKLVSELQQLQARYAEEAARRKEAEAEKVGTEGCGLASVMWG